MEISKIKIRKVPSTNGLIGFASMVVDGWLILNNIAVFSRLNQEDKCRLVFPEKKLKVNTIRLFHPLTSEAYFVLEQAVEGELNKPNEEQIYG